MKKLLMLTVSLCITLVFNGQAVDYLLKNRFDTLSLFFHNTEEALYEGLTYNPYEIFILDSVVDYTHNIGFDSTSVHRTIISYNQLENSQTTIVFHRQSKDHPWENYSKTIRYFNDRDLLEMVLFYQGDEQIWIKRQKSIYEYNSNSKIDFYLNYQWDSNIYDWYLSSKTDLQYYSNGSTKNRTLLSFNRELQQWINNTRNEYYYDGEDRIYNELFLVWDENILGWDEISWDNYLYESDGKTIVYYHKDSTGWIPYTKSKEIWITKDTCYTTQEKLTPDSTWFLVRESNCVFNEFNTLIYQESYRFLEPDSVWIGDMRFENIVNDKNQTTDRINHKWDFWNEQWELNTMVSYGYNDLDILFYSCTKMYNEGVWDKGWSTYKYYSSPEDVSNQIDDGFSTSIYPNPATTHITLSDSKYSLHLHNLHGQLILTSELGEQTISLEGVMPGVYVATVKEGEEIVAREKLIMR